MILRDTLVSNQYVISKTNDITCPGLHPDADHLLLQHGYWKFAIDSSEPLGTPSLNYIETLRYAVPHARVGIDCHVELGRYDFV
jgi:hypothetical protein